MGYLKRHGHGRQARTGMGDAIGTVLSTTQDPYLSETICRVGQLAAIENRQPVSPCGTTPAGIPGGVGLRRVMPALRAYVYAESHAWVYPVAALGVIGVPMLLGYLIARRG